jgi:TetR/AcrR family transcriptional regulator, cholesterol catabolism regulator
MTLLNERSLNKAPEDRRAEIMSVARLLFSERGYEGTSMRDIASVLGVSVASLYVHIAAKEDLLWEIVLRASDDFMARARAVADAEPDPRKRLHRLIEQHIRYVTDNLDVAAVLHDEWRALSPARRHEIGQRRRAYEDLFADAIADGARTGVFEVDDVKLATLLVLSAANWTYKWYRDGGRLSSTEVSDRFDALLGRAFRPVAPGRPLSGAPRKKPPKRRESL